jgi:hypothetical protein
MQGEQLVSLETRLERIAADGRVDGREDKMSGRQIRSGANSSQS